MILSVNLTFGLSEVLVLLFGILMGLIWGAFIFIKRKRKLILSHINKGYNNISDEEKQLVEKKINDIYSYHTLVRKNKIKMFFGLVNIKKQVKYEELAETKLGIVRNEENALSITSEIWWLINEIAKIYYPNSKYPLYELSIDEILLLAREIISLVYNIIDDLGIPNLKKVKIIQLKDLLLVTGKVNKIYNIRGVQITIKCFNAAIKLQSVLTPIYWIKKGTNVLTVSSLSQFIIKSMFELIAKETANIYSKNFTKN